MRISDWSSDVCSSDLSRLISWSIARPTTSRGASSPRLSCRSMKRLPPPGTPGGSFTRPPSPPIASVIRQFFTSRFSLQVGWIWFLFLFYLRTPPPHPIPLPSPHSPPPPVAPLFIPPP